MGGKASARRAEAPSPGTTDVLGGAPELAEGLSQQELALARRQSRAPLIGLATGIWEPPLVEAGAAFGFIVIKGLLIRRVQVRGGQSIELLGPGDLLGPAICEGGFRLGASSSEWDVLEPSAVATLGRDWHVRMSQWPTIAGALACRALDRTHSAAIRLALAQIRSLPERLWLLLWHLSDRYGDVLPDRTATVPLALTHKHLAELACAQREPVTRTLNDLARLRLVAPRPGAGWLLSEPSPPTVEALAATAAPGLPIRRTHGRGKAKKRPSR